MNQSYRKSLSKFGQFMYNLVDAWGMFIIKHKILYWIIMFTWALPTTILGLLVSLVCLINRIKPYRYHYGVWFFEVGGSAWGGLEMGVCFLEGPRCMSVREHEFGHVVAQTTLLGPFMIVEMIAGGVRYWYRELYFTKKGRVPDTDYDDVWWERSATDTGKKLVKYITEKEQEKKQKKE